jgi:hypothetical protein
MRVFLKLPEPRKLPGMSKRFPYVFVADAAFALKPFNVKPYGKNSLHDYRISRARRVM